MKKTLIRAAVLTVSDTRGPHDDLSGNRLVELLMSAEAEVVVRRTVTDDPALLRDTLFTLTERDDVNLIITTGGTGFGPRDNTPEATRAVVEREAPGLAEAMRRETIDKTPLAILSRGICGIRGATLIINLPGSQKAVDECFEVLRPVLTHAVSLVCGETDHI